MTTPRAFLLAIAALLTLAGGACQRASHQAATLLGVSHSHEAAESAVAKRAAGPNTPLTPLEKLIAAGVEQATYTTGYDPAYVKLAYPGGDVPRETGVCADVIVRAFRACGLDLQQAVHEDMTRNFAAYPKSWNARKPDTNIDHRRVGNLMKWFERQGKSLPVSEDGNDYAPGDVVAWDLGNGRLHVGLMTDIKSDGGRYALVHNIGAGARIEDVLFNWKVIGRYRYFEKQIPQPQGDSERRSNRAAAATSKTTLKRDSKNQ